MSRRALSFLTGAHSSIRFRLVLVGRCRAMPQLHFHRLAVALTGRPF